MRALAITLAIATTLASSLSLAQAPANASASRSYADMCKQAVNMPTEYGGEQDIKGHPKLDAYCNCFGDKFAARAVKSLPQVQKDGTLKPVSDTEARKIQAEDFAMRKSCRAQHGLPAPKPLAK